jgi:hypothetical protein
MEPPKKQQNQPQPSGPRGRFLGLVSTGKELYQVVMLETEGDRVVKRTVLEAGREETRGGKTARGASLAVALSAFTLETSRRIREASDLWQA